MHSYISGEKSKKRPGKYIKNKNIPKDNKKALFFIQKGLLCSVNLHIGSSYSKAFPSASFVTVTISTNIQIPRIKTGTTNKAPGKVHKS